MDEVVDIFRSDQKTGTCQFFYIISHILSSEKVINLEFIIFINVVIYIFVFHYYM